MEGAVEAVNALRIVHGALNPPDGGRVVVQYDAAENACRACLALLCQGQGEGRLQALEFVFQDVKSLAGLFLSQDPFPMSSTNHQHTEAIATTILSIFLALQYEDQSKLLGVLDAIFSHDVKTRYYNAYRKSHTGVLESSGCHHLRTRMARTFAEQGGFEILLRILQAEEQKNGQSSSSPTAAAAAATPGEIANKAVSNGNLDVIVSVLKCMNDVREHVELKTRNALVDLIFERLLSESDDQLKKDRSLDAIHRLISALGNLCVTEDPSKFYDFWMAYTLRLMGSGTLVLRLFAWDQVNEIIRDVVSMRPLAKAYRVENAGSEFVNGEYQYIRGWPSGATYDLDCGLYSKEPSNEDEPLLTIFRCAMQTGQKWWFISKADPYSPGGKKDIDFYQNSMQSPDWLNEPPLFGWVTQSSNNKASDPPPTLTRIPSEKELESKTLLQTVADWALQNKLLEHAFSASLIKSEIVSRSNRLLQLLVECNLVSDEILRWIWKAAMQNQDIIISESVFSVLSNISRLLSYELFTALIDAALESLSQDDSLNVVVKVALFLEKMACEDVHFIASYISVPSSDKLLNLVWAVYRSSHFETLKNSFIIQELLSKCLIRDENGRMTMQRVRECVDTLRGYRTSAKKVDEVVACRVIDTLQFLTSKLNGFVSTTDSIQEAFPSTIFEEIERFTSSNRPRLACGKVDEVWFNAHLASRLQLLRQFYGISTTVKVPLRFVDSMWTMFSRFPNELDTLFEFFMKGVDFNQQFESIFQVEDIVSVFNQYVCSPAINWATCSCLAFDCFNAFFSLESRSLDRFSSFTEQSRDIGLETLWRITLSINSPEATAKAMSLLLKHYEDSIAEEASKPKMFEIAFTHLQNVLALLSGSASNDFDDSCKTRVIRCVELLSSAISHVGSSSFILSHAVCGTMSRFPVTVHYRKVRQYSNATTAGSTYYPTVERTDGTTTLSLHPLMTVSQLKEKVRKEAMFPDVNNISLENTTTKTLMSLASSSRLEELGLTDGAEIHVVYTIKSNFPAGRTNEFLSPSQIPIGESISGDEAQFACLLTLCDMIKDVDTRKKIWKLLMIVPTNDASISRVRLTCADFLERYIENKQQRINWHSVFGSSISQMTYMLQVIDHLMKPSEDFVDAANFSSFVKRAFILSGGFSYLLHILTTVDVAGDEIKRTALSTSLHMLHYFLFDSENNTFVPAENLIEELESCSHTIVDKLLSVASDAAEMETSDVVQEAFEVLSRLLLKSPSATAQLTANPQSKKLLAFCLRSASQNVRKISSKFAVFVGNSQPVVFQWLLAEVEHVDHNDTLCSETFSALCELLQTLSKESKKVINIEDLAKILSLKLLAFPAQPKRSSGGSVPIDTKVLYGYLNLLEVVVREHFESLSTTELGPQLVERFFDKFLFALPSFKEEEDMMSICNSRSTRSMAFKILLAYIKCSPSSLLALLASLSRLKSQGTQQISQAWMQQVSHDVKKSSIKFSGLKNHGCTCYINSLLQQLYMCSSFREAILRAPIREDYRHSISHYSNEDLVGKIVRVDIGVDRESDYLVVGFDPSSGKHQVRLAANMEEDIDLKNFCMGKLARVFSPDAPEDVVNPPNAAALAILEQLQRTFYHMKFSNRRFFDPFQLLEACKVLPLQFSVYQQNDVSEFQDTIFDQLETSLKSDKHSTHVWNDIFKMFFCEVAFQKTPKDCDVYRSRKEDCGHVTSTKIDSVSRIPLEISGKDKIDDSLTGFFESEHMDGIDCEKCEKKKDTTRRPTLNRTPNNLILHLKRFQLDFQTFETIKINSRMEFPTRINMLKYSKEGIKFEEEKKKAAEEAAEPNDGSSSPISPSRRSSGRLQYEEDSNDPDAPNSEDYEYELQGVLVHAGVAQGGHYYSFGRDPENKQQWYRLEDEEVTVFNPENIAFQCFGGPVSSSSGSYGTALDNSSREDERSANALLLFYSKVKPAETVVVESASVNASSESDNSPSGSRLIDGYEAFKDEVQWSNLQHTLLKYLFDDGVHIFVQDLLELIINLPDGAVGSDALLVSLQFACEFFVDVVLHFKDRSKKDCRVWHSLIKQGFALCHHGAEWFLASDNFQDWQLRYFKACPDANARKSFDDLQVAALSVLVQADQAGLYPTGKVDDIIAQYVVGIMDSITSYVFDPKNFDEVVILIRDLAKIPRICIVLLRYQFIVRLAFFLDPQAQEASNVKKFYETEYFKNTNHTESVGNRNDYAHVMQSVYEAIAAMIGVPQVRKVGLLTENPTKFTNYTYSTTSWDLSTELTEDARDAFTTIFSECCSLSPSGVCVMTGDEVAAFSARFGHKTHNAEMLRKSLSADGSLTLEGFLNYQTEKHDQKLLWAELHAFGFRNDLSRVSPSEEPPTMKITEAESLSRAISTALENCCPILANHSIYDYGLKQGDLSALAIAKVVCTHGAGDKSISFDQSISLGFIHKALERLLQVSNAEGGYSSSPALLTGIISFLQTMCSIDDDWQILRVREVLLHESLGLASIVIYQITNPTPSSHSYYSLKVRYLEIVSQFSCNPDTTRAFTAVAESSNEVNLVKRMLKKPGNFDHCLSEEEEECVATATVIVSDAAVPEVNGVYLFSGIQRDAGMYSRNGTFQGEPMVFSVYKFKINSARGEDSQWFISAVPPGKGLGSKEDKDFYYGISDSDALYEGRILPPTIFRADGSNFPHTRLPAPKIQINFQPLPSQSLSLPYSLNSSRVETDDSSAEEVDTD